jgi:hypothetical protein
MILGHRVIVFHSQAEKIDRVHCDTERVMMYLEYESNGVGI